MITAKIEILREGHLQVQARHALRGSQGKPDRWQIHSRDSRLDVPKMDNIIIMAKGKASHSHSSEVQMDSE
jgi:hypothetical protein